MAGLNYYLEDVMFEGEQAEAYKKRKAEEARKAAEDEEKAKERQEKRMSRKDTEDVFTKKYFNNPKTAKKAEKAAKETYGKYNKAMDHPNSRMAKLNKDIKAKDGKYNSTEASAVTKMLSRADKEFKKRMRHESMLDYYFDLV